MGALVWFSLMDVVSAQCVQACIEVDQQVGLGYDGRIYFHQFSETTALNLYAQQPPNNATPRTNGSTIQRWRRTNCCTPDCPNPPSTGSMMCSFGASADWSDRDCDTST
jgi:hypothetical protein